MRAVIVEPNPTMAVLVKFALGLYGHEVICTISATEALSTIRSELVDVVLIETTSADSVGLLRLITALKRQSRKRKLAIVLMAGYTEVVDGHIRAYADDFLTKPFQPIVLSARLETAVHCVKRRRSGFRTAPRNAHQLHRNRRFIRRIEYARR